MLLLSMRKMLCKCVRCNFACKIALGIISWMTEICLCTADQPVDATVHNYDLFLLIFLYKNTVLNIVLYNRDGME
jgi:hypothetical protein